MKIPPTTPRSIQRLRGAHVTGSVELGGDRLVIRLPDPIFLRLVSRSVLVAAALLTLLWIRATCPNAEIGGSPPKIAGGSRWIDKPFYLPMLLGDLKREGLLRLGDRAISIGDPGSRLSVLRMCHVDHVPGRLKPEVPDRSVDFVLAADGLSRSGLGFVNRVLRTGGVVAVRLGTAQSSPFRLPPNYTMVYIRRFGSTIVAIKKFEHAADE